MARPFRQDQIPREAVLRIRKIAALRRSLPTLKSLAREYGINPVTASRIASGVWYKRVRENVDIEKLARELESRIEVE